VYTPQNVAGTPQNQAKLPKPFFVPADYLCGRDPMNGTTDIQSKSPSEPRKTSGVPAQTFELEKEFMEVLSPFVNSMPAISWSVFELNALLTRGTPELAALAKVVRSDPVITAQVLRAAAPTSNWAIEGALVLIGLDSLRAIVLRTPVITAGHQEFSRLQALWRHSNISAQLSEKIAQFCGHDRDQAYVASLVHDIGKVALLLAPPHGSRSSSSDDAPLKPLHCAAGGWLARSWNLAPPLIEVIETHHEPSLSASNPFLVAIVAAANAFCHAFHLDDGSASLGVPSQSAAGDILRTTLPFLGGRERSALADILTGELVRCSGPQPVCDAGFERTS
jgi:HD-like signal output (HDOD) protein